MTVLSLPAIRKPNKTRFYLRAASQTFVSPLTGAMQTLEMVGARWRCMLEWENLVEEEWRLLSALQAQLLGEAGRLYVPPFHALNPRGVGTGTPLVKNASQTGKSLTTDGWTFSQTGILKAGDFFAFDTSNGRELKQIVADVNSDGSGNATLVFSPSIRVSPVDNEPIVVSSPSAVMRLVDDEQGQLDMEFQGAITFDLEEAYF